MNFFLHIVVYFDIYLILAISLNLVVGYCGRLTLAHASFYAVGGYTYAILTLNYGWGFVPATAVAMVIAAILSLAISLPSWRLQGDYFVLASLSVQVLVLSAIYNGGTPGARLGTWNNLTNGPFGIAGIPKLSLLGWRVSDPLSFAVFASVIAALCTLVLWRLQTSPWGRLLMCMRDDELATRSLGKNTRLAKVQAFAISGALAAVAGAVYASYTRYVDPSLSSIDESIVVLSMGIVGGFGNLRGPVIGAAILVGIPAVLRLLDFPDAHAASLRVMIYGVLLVALMHFRPQGVGGSYRVQ